ncbi:DoxX family protein [Lysinibacillus sp. 2017]|uniref:DoxX family protein n=1 Tax=unclassified Lysinibacillus TaxID=2636778 RepID=UPI000D529854|nr:MULTISPECIES: DoxX family protein [unclassified Lysinibacillus]AWE07214.1 DoxX family protein [Lysinibacillus sp. 2017]TGN34672.1 DoxX family protein [Lysinibacillus sp. S2017]
MTVLAMVLQGILALMFIMAGFGKVSGSKMHIEGFTKWGYPQWFRVVTGLIELIAAALLIVGFWNETAAIIGVAILVAVGIGGVITHIRIKDTMKDTALILVLGILALALLIILL